MTEPLITRYRPTTWAEVLGQSAAVKSLSGLIKRKESRAFMLSGPSGAGKTTLARIAAVEMGCDEPNIIEKDGATYTGIDSMRELQQIMQYAPFGKSKMRAIVIDEAHRLSKQAWDSLLKSVEEPSEHTAWFFCTTDPAKVPGTIKTRCSHIQLKPVAEKDLRKLLEYVCEQEDIDLHGDVEDIIVREAHGSPRQLLVNLGLCRDMTKKKEAADVLKTALESDPIIELCRFMSNGKGSWSKAMSIISKMDDENPEGVRLVVVNYFGSALKGARTDREAQFFLTIIDHFCVPYSPAEGIAPLLLSVGRAMFAE